MLRRAIGFVRDLLLPRRCEWCGKVLGFTEGCACAAEREALRMENRPLERRLDKPLAFSTAWACYRYDGLVRDALWRLKFSGEKELAAPMGKAMAEVFAQCAWEDAPDLVAAAPSSEHTLKTRGYNQSALLAQQLANQMGLRFEPEAVKKKKDTETQMSLDRAGRLKNLKDAFAADAQLVHGRCVLLVDDIITTGSTANECAAALVQAGARKCCVLCVAATEY